MRKPLPAGPPAPPGSLAEALAVVPDPRRPFGWRPEYPPIPLVALLQVTVAAMLCGARSLYAVTQWVRERQADTPGLLRELGLPPGRCPCAATFHRLFKALDVDQFEAAVGTWLAHTGIAPDDALAVDGKNLRGIHGDCVPGVYLVAAYAHAAGAILAQLRTDGKGHELAAAEQVLSQVPLTGRVVTGDALLTQRRLCHQVAAAEGAYLFPVAENQPTLQADLRDAFPPLAPHGPGRVGSAPAPRVVAARLGGPRRDVERGYPA